jgi:RHS repeat-associated protein
MGQGEKVRYEYNGLGQRTLKIDSGSTIVYHYDNLNRLIAETGQHGGLIKEYIWLDHELIAVGESGAMYYVHTNHRNQPHLATDAEGEVVWRGVSTPFGSTSIDNGQGGPSGLCLNLRLPGQYFDLETGFHHNYHRDYSPDLGSYLQADPIGLNGGMLLYGYCDGDPVNREDVWGLIWRTTDITIDWVDGAAHNTAANFAAGFETGKFGYGASPATAKNNTRTVTQTWEADPGYPEKDKGFPIGTTRSIRQTTRDLREYQNRNPGMHMYSTNKNTIETFANKLVQDPPVPDLTYDSILGASYKGTYEMEVTFELGLYEIAAQMFDEPELSNVSATSTSGAESTQVGTGTSSQPQQTGDAWGAQIGIDPGINSTDLAESYGDGWGDQIGAETNGFGSENDDDDDWGDDYGAGYEGYGD